MNDAPMLAEAQQSTALVVVPPAALPLIVAADKDGILESLARKVAAFEPDVSTPKGRAAMRSLAYEIAQAKSKLDGIGKGLTEEQRALIDKVNAERRLIRDKLEELQDKVRAPLTEYENAEKARVAAHEAGIATIEGWAEVPAEWTSEQIAARIAELGNDPLLARDWQEFAQRAQKAAAAARNALRAALADAREREAAAAAEAQRQADETERRRQEEERQRQEREAEIARLAAEQARQEAEAKAEQERQEAERHAQAEREAAARREQEAREAAERAEQQRQEAEERARRQAELAEANRVQRCRDRIHEIETADQFAHAHPPSTAIQSRIDALGAAKLDGLDEFADEAEHTRDATLTRLRAMLAEATEREARHAVLVAEQQKRQADADAAARLKAQQAAERAEQEKRAANVAHRRSVNNKARDAVFAILKAEWNDPNSTPDLVLLAQRVIEGIAKGEIPAVSIQY